jgi:hypothetical protein
MPETFLYVRLHAVNGVERLVQKQPHSPADINPWRAILIQCRRIVKQGQEVRDDEGEAGQCDLVVRFSMAAYDILDERRLTRFGLDIQC